MVFEYAAVDISSFQKNPFLPSIIRMIAFHPLPTCPPPQEACGSVRERKSIVLKEYSEQRKERKFLNECYISSICRSFLS